MKNLPPGVSSSSIPGNRPEDQEWEDLWNKVFDYCETNIIEFRALIEDAKEKIVDNLTEFIYDIGETRYNQGYIDGERVAKIPEDL